MFFSFADLEVRDLQESIVNAEDYMITVGDASIAGRRFSVIRMENDEVFCVSSEVFKLFFGQEEGPYREQKDHAKRQWWKKR